MTFAISVALVAVLVGLSIWAPPKVALVALLLSGHLDFSGPDSSAQVDIGYLNLFKIVVPAIVLAVRLGYLRARWNLAALLLAIYVFSLIVQIPFTQFPLPLLKYIVYIGVYGLIAFICVRGHQLLRLQTLPVLVALTGVPIVLALIQTYVLKGVFGTADERFTSFTDPQEFAIYYLGISALILTSEIRLRVRLLLVAGALIAVLSSGSRTALICAATMLVVWCCLNLFSKSVSKSLLALATLGGLLLGSAFVVAFPSSLGTGRSTEAVVLFLSGDSDLTQIGTFDFRTNVAASAIDTLSSGGVLRTFVGHGYGAAAGAVLRAGSRATVSSVDPNRALHNEYLQVLLESGILGLILLFGALIALIVSTAKHGVNQTMILVVPAVVVALYFENVLVGSGGASGWGLMAALTASATNFTGRSTIGFSRPSGREGRDGQSHYLSQ